ncbi:excinuclease ABC subunit UvrA [Patescibacteria group bacterium]|nr:excinuclease ABC subunit UvrA [Patescibacteria group bacterium]
MEPKSIIVRGARVHNLKNITVEIPKNKMTVVTGLSGSGKSSLVFDTIYAEGRRRYVESLSSYARQFLGLEEKPDVDEIEGLSPTIAINQRSIAKNPRSTVGTITEIYDYMRLLWANIGIPHCPKCNKIVTKQTTDEIISKILSLEKNKKILIIAPVIRGKKGEHKDVISKIQSSGYVRVRIDGTIMDIEEAIDKTLEKTKKHTIEIIVDRIILEDNLSEDDKKEQKERITNSVETALDLGNGIIIVNIEVDNKLDENKIKSKDIFYSQNFACPDCDINLEEISPRSFSFNNPYGACPECSGLGIKQRVDPDLLIPNKKLSINEGAILPWQKIIMGRGWNYRILVEVAKENNIDLDMPVEKLQEKDLNIILYGTQDRLYKIGRFSLPYEGVINNLERRYRETDSEYSKLDIEKYMITEICPLCNGKKLKKEFLGVLVRDKNIIEVTDMHIDDSIVFFENLLLTLTDKEKQIVEKIVKEILVRLKFLQNLGLGYLSLSRNSQTLSGGESQRIRLATQIGSSLSGVIYVLDEPTIGLHKRDNDRLIDSLIKLKNLGNTILVVEHDEDVMQRSDYIIDIGPGAGKHGGKLIYAGTVDGIKNNEDSITGMYLSGRKQILIPKERRKGNGKFIEIKGAREFNLKDINVKIPLNEFVCLTGVSGSGKSTLMIDILANYLLKKFYKSKVDVGEFKEINGTENIDKIINIDQSPIGRTPRSNIATYTGIFNTIRELFAQTTEAKIRGYKAGRFSFNVEGGRCENCHGDGVIKIEMQFLPDVYITCDVCKGKRYNESTLEIHYKEKNIADILDMTVEDAIMFFKDIPAIYPKLKVLNDVGLGYIKLGQSATTLSGGEAQRIKLATELARKSTAKTLYILDEPTTGLHFEDINKLLQILHKLVDKGNSVLVIEHNLDVIKTADYIIDLGPEGGDKGGYIVAEGAPEDIVEIDKGYTSKYLREVLLKNR